MKKLAWLTLLVSTVGFADSKSAANALISEPASALDIIMLRISDFAEWTRPDLQLSYRLASTSQESKLNINAEFDRREGKIHVWNTIRDGGADLSEMEIGCRKVLGLMHVNLATEFYDILTDKAEPYASTVPNEDIVGMVQLHCVVTNWNGQVEYRADAALADGEIQVVDVE